jgi:predicted nucleotidyltransferase component of viral defense system
MIPESYIEQWRQHAPWQALFMIEQDLIISRALVDLYNHPIISSALVFRGGTALNKLYLQPPARYSEDIDFVQIKAAPIGEVITAISESLDSWLGEPKRKLTERSVKLIYHYQTTDNIPAKLKIEINTTEHFQVETLKSADFEVNSEWFNGKTKIITYQIDELIATKLRALYQRRKGRDLFDLWLVLKNNLVNPKQVIKIFATYNKHNKEIISRVMFEKNIAEKEAHPDFASDMKVLLAPTIEWPIEEAFELVRAKLIALI